MTDDLQSRAIRAEEAKQLLANPHLREAFAAVDQYLDERALSCNPDNKEQAQRIVISKQLLAAIRREIERKVEDGEMVKVEMEQLEKRSIVRRFIR